MLFRSIKGRKERDELREHAFNFIEILESKALTPRQVESTFRALLPQAARLGDVWLLSLLMHRGASRQAQPCERALLEAAAAREHKAAQAILAFKPPIGKETLDNVLLLAAQQNASELIPPLLLGGASVNARAKNGDTALIVALRAGAKDAAHALILGGADVSVCGEKGTPLMHAAERAYYDLCDLMLCLGADPLVQVCGYRAIDCARDAKTFRIIDKWRTIRLLSQFKEFHHSI
ncbi:MAG: ankyrin repeat domain-containing protein [Candidatus Micrarchaeota archaeon]|nr:ankyrin repeat domain-containing protein [Candidatus Micrarchaeota archaeon]